MINEVRLSWFYSLFIGLCLLIDPSRVRYNFGTHQRAKIIATVAQAPRVGCVDAPLGPFLGYATTDVGDASGPAQRVI